MIETSFSRGESPLSGNTLRKILANGRKLLADREHRIVALQAQRANAGDAATRSAVTRVIAIEKQQLADDRRELAAATQRIEARIAGGDL